MKLCPRLVAGVFCLVAAGPAAAATCAEEIAALEGRLREQATAAISSSTGSKEVAASREGRAIEARERDVPVTSLPNAPVPGTPEAEATARAEEAGGGGDRVMQAKATLNRARTLDQQGNSAACSEAVAEAKRQLDQ
jgi:hypothetical protein